MSKIKKDERSKNWVAVMYPESLPDNWETLLRELKIDVIVSPLHDSDVNPDGERKKPHYHVVLKFSSNKSFKQVTEILEPFNCPAPQKVASMKGQIRYLVHADNPEKAQYSQQDIKIIGSVDLAQYFKLTENDKYNHIAEMMEFVDEQGLMEISHLMRYAREQRRDDWFPLLCGSAGYMMDRYISSIRNELKNKKEQQE